MIIDQKRGFFVILNSVRARARGGSLSECNVRAEANIGSLEITFCQKEAELKKERKPKSTHSTKVIKIIR